MTIQQIQTKLDKYFGLRSTVKDSKLIYYSPANIEIFYVQLYKNRSGQYMMDDVYFNATNLYINVYKNLKD